MIYLTIWCPTSGRALENYLEDRYFDSFGWDKQE